MERPQIEHICNDCVFYCPQDESIEITTVEADLKTKNTNRYIVGMFCRKLKAHLPNKRVIKCTGFKAKKR